MIKFDYLIAYRNDKIATFDVYKSLNSQTNHNCKSFGRHQRSKQAAGWCVMRALDKNVVAKWIAKRVPVGNQESVMGGVGNNLLRMYSILPNNINNLIFVWKIIHIILHDYYGYAVYF